MSKKLKRLIKKKMKMPNLDNPRNRVSIDVSKLINKKTYFQQKISTSLLDSYN